MTTENKPTQEELEELAALALCMGHEIARNVADGAKLPGDGLSTFAAITMVVGRDIYRAKPPAWMEAARARCLAKAAADIQKFEAEGTL